MAPSQQPTSLAGSTPECLELRDQRAPRRMKALRAFIAVSALGWLAFAVLVSASTPDPLPPDLAAGIALGEAGPPAAVSLPASPADQAILVSQDTTQE